MSKQSALVSIIIPIYNGKNYINSSILTVFDQTYDRIELLAVDDGSTDDSFQVLSELVKQAPIHVDMRIIRQDNGGICRARNRGIEEAKGEYIMFMDQDDKMYSDCVANLVSLIEKENADLVIGGFDLIDKEGKVLEQWTLNPTLSFSPFRISAPWGRIFRRTVMDRHNIRFMVTKISEDFYFNVLFMSYADKIVVSPYRGYCWLYNEGSESHAHMSQLKEDRNPLVMLEQLHKDMNSAHGLDRECLQYMMTKHIVWYLLYVAKGADAALLKKMYCECFSWLTMRYPHATKISLRKLTFPKGEQVKVRSIVKTCIVLHRMRLFMLFLRIYSVLFRS